MLHQIHENRPELAPAFEREIVYAQDRHNGSLGRGPRHHPAEDSHPGGRDSQASCQPGTQTARCRETDGLKRLRETDGRLGPRLNKLWDALRENLALALGIRAKELLDCELEADRLSSAGNILESQ